MKPEDKMNFPLFATLKEFIITGSNQIDVTVADKLYQFHILPMQNVREELGVWVTASLKSGYRPQWHERLKGRSGKSEHTYIEEWEKGSGAVDWTCKDFEENKDRFLNLIIEYTNYTRIAVYNGFIHCDYKPNGNGKRALYTSDANSNWKLDKYFD